MNTSNISLGSNVRLDPSSSINNISIGDHVRISKYTSAFGSPTNILEIGANTTIGMFSMINGFEAKLTIGKNCSIAQNVLIMTGSGPNASELMQRHYPLIEGPVLIEDHVWIGAGVIITPNVTVGRCSIIAANSFVATSLEPYGLYGGTPAKLIKKLTQIELDDRKEIPSAE